jgi:limonene-1,2-epoxide hydrolase
MRPLWIPALSSISRAVTRSGELLTKALAKYKTLDWEISNTIKAGDDLIVEGTMIGKLPQKTVRVPFVSIFHFKDSKISTQRDMFDVLHFFLQLGARMINREEEGTKE